MNTIMHYLYRDAANNKNHGSVVVSGEFGPSDLAAITETLSDGEHFVAEQVGVDSVFLFNEEADYDPDDPSTYPSDMGAGNYAVCDADHGWHEFGSLELTDRKPTDERSIQELVEAFRAAASAGWEAQDPTMEVAA